MGFLIHSGYETLWLFFATVAAESPLYEVPPSNGTTTLGVDMLTGLAAPATIVGPEGPVVEPIRVVRCALRCAGSTKTKEEALPRHAVVL
jgi:hypothetical protein